MSFDKNKFHKIKHIVSANSKTEKNCSLSNLEIFILRLVHQVKTLVIGHCQTMSSILLFLHQVVCVSTYNSQQVHKLTPSFQLDRIGAAVNPSLSLVNHSCDSNSIRCNVNKSSILVAVNHIPMGQEITESYTVHFRFKFVKTFCSKFELILLEECNKK